MRIIVFFDLPTYTPSDRKEYRKFKKFLVKEGFLFMQESVYSKLAINQSNVVLIKNKVNKNKPPHGLVQVLTITERQYASIENLIGQQINVEIDSTERLVIL